VRYGFLKQSDMQNQQAIEEGKKKYESTIGEPLETKGDIYWLFHNKISAS
jgi:hypothetical protein